MALIFDTGPLVAMLDASDPEHERCAALAAGCHERRVVPVCVLVELEYQLRSWPRAFAGFLADVEKGGFELLDLPGRWLLRAGELLERYRDASLGLVDATVIAATEMLDEPKVATLDRRDFSLVRPCHCEALRLLPE